MGGAKALPVVTITDADLEANGGQYKLTGQYAMKVNGDDDLDILGGTPAVVYPVSQAQVASGEFELIQGHATDVAQVAGRGQESSAWAMPVYHVGPGTWPPGGAAPIPTYSDKVLGYSPILYLPMSETSDTTAVNAANPGTGDGTYTGATLNSITGPDGVNGAPLFDGVNDFVDFYSVYLSGVVPANEGSSILWVRAADYSHNPADFVLSMGEDTSNRLRWYTRTSPDGFVIEHTAAGLPKGAAIAQAGITLNAWNCFGISWSLSNDEVKVYLNGAQTGTTQTGLNPWSTPTLSSTLCTLASGDTIPSSNFAGYLAHFALFSSPLNDATFLDLATV